MNSVPKAQEIYRHFKGNLYQIVSVAEHTESEELLVVYQALYGDFKVYARPLEMFCSKVDREKYPDAKQEYRFERQTAWNTVCGEREALNYGQHSSEKVQIDTEMPVELPVAGKVAEELKLQETDETVCVAEEPTLDPMLLAFLDAETYAEKLNILAGMHHRITDDMITTLAIASDIEIGEGDLEKRYVQLKNCLQTLDRYEINRQY